MFFEGLPPGLFTDTGYRWVEVSVSSVPVVLTSDEAPFAGHFYRTV